MDIGIDLSQKRCDSKVGTHGALSGPELYQSDFHWGYSLLEMESDFWKIYESGKRLRYPAEFDSSSKSFRVFRETSNGVEAVQLTDRFIKNVTMHLEEALQNQFAEFIFFPDMGHSHLYMDQNIWAENYEEFLAKGGVGSHSKFYERILADPALHALYHTAEQLEMMVGKVLLEDPHLLFRYWNRNPVGKHDGSGLVTPMPVKTEGGFNTVGSLPGMQSWSAGFEVSSSKNGCFAYRTRKGELLFFDIGLIPLQMDPSLPVSGDMY